MQPGGKSGSSGRGRGSRQGHAPGAILIQFHLAVSGALDQSADRVQLRSNARGAPLMGPVSTRQFHTACTVVACPLSSVPIPLSCCLTLFPVCARSGSGLLCCSRRRRCCVVFGQRSQARVGSQPPHHATGQRDSQGGRAEEHACTGAVGGPPSESGCLALLLLTRVLNRHSPIAVASIADRARDSKQLIDHTILPSTLFLSIVKSSHR
jgi:hypothetical protein